MSTYLLMMLCGVLVAMPFGPMGFLTIQHFRHHRYRKAAALVSGCIAADTIYAAIAMLGISFLTEETLESWPMLLASAAGLLLAFWLAWRWRNRPQHLAAGFFAGFLANIAQPKTVLLVSGAMLLLGVSSSIPSITLALPAYVAGELFIWVATATGGAFLWRYLPRK